MSWRKIVSTGQSELKKVVFRPEFSGNEQIQMVFTTEEFLEVATEIWSEWDLNPWPLNSVQTLKLTELWGHYIYGERTPDFAISCYLVL